MHSHIPNKHIPNTSPNPRSIKNMHNYEVRHRDEGRGPTGHKKYKLGIQAAEQGIMNDVKMSNGRASFYMCVEVGRCGMYEGIPSKILEYGSKVSGSVDWEGKVTIIFAVHNKTYKHQQREQT